jgi:hypothetical protein
MCAQRTLHRFRVMGSAAYVSPQPACMMSTVTSIPASSLQT